MKSRINRKKQYYQSFNTKKRSNIMKKILVVAILICAISALSFAGTASTSANVTANVTAAVTVNNTLPMAFGNVTLGTSPSVLSNSAAAAAFTISGAANTATGVTIVYPATLVSGANSMVFTSSVLPRTNTVAAAATAVTTYSTDASDIVGALTSGTGALFLYVGGQIAVDAAQAAGSYSGTITVTVTQ
jgi:spore coat protein U-like protein